VTEPTITRTDRDRVAILTLDTPGRSMNVVDETVLADLRDQFAVLGDDVDAVVLTSGKPGSFGAGADVAWLPELAARDDAADVLSMAHDLALTMARSPRPVVTAVPGPAYGGALELALGGEAIVATPDATLGLPEVTLGLIPGGGGTQLLRRWLVLDDALDVLLSGRPLQAREALDRGLVTRIAPRERLLDDAVELARELVTSGSRRPDRPVPARDGVAVLERHAQAVAARRGGATPPALAILAVVRTGEEQGIEAGFAAETAAFLDLLRSPAAQASLHLFQAGSDLKRRTRRGDRIDALGVIGAGQMGAGIAATAVSRGIGARVRDVSDDALVRARAYVDRVLQRAGDDPAVQRRRYRWSATRAWTGLGHVDVVVEAVFEDPDLKVDVLAEVSRHIAPTALVASNTSAIPIHRLAPAVDRPERFLGMHFFSPVDRMPLVELIPHAATAPETVDRAAAIAGQLGKVPVVVGDTPGFFTSRVYARWLVEGIRLLLDGVPPTAIDEAAVTAGFPVGPLQAHDEATLDLVVQASITQVAEHVMSARIDVPAVRGALETLVAAGVRGRRYGLGFYRYDDDGRRTGINEDVVALVGAAQPDPDVTACAGDRLLLAFATECFLCWDDGTLCHPDDGDVAAVLGIAFPRPLGGPFHWADATGAGEVVARCTALGVREFPPGDTLTSLAASGGRFADAPRRAAPFQPAE
jgi:3-hydroxyacyl-CoA dehydrogenase / enoyl-CoA hydratase / 3-hydroxybutyryl-CoA epimerase